VANGSTCSGSGTFVDGGYNLADDSGTTCGFSAASHDVLGMGPALGPLAANGGPTETMAPDVGSPALNQIPPGTTANSVSLCPSTDQRGVVRPDASVGSNCDIGAEELALPVAQKVSETTAKDTPQDMPAGTLQTGVTDSNPGVTSWVSQLASDASHGAVTVNSDGSFRYVPQAGFVGADSFTYELTDSYGISSVPAMVTLDVATGLLITTTSLPQGTLKVNYSAALTAGGGNPPYKWSLSLGNLPKGLHLKKVTGVISGRPLVTGTYTFTVKVVDKKIKVKHQPPTQNAATKVLSITVS